AAPHCARVYSHISITAPIVSRNAGIVCFVPDWQEGEQYAQCYQGLWTHWVAVIARPLRARAGLESDRPEQGEALHRSRKAPERSEPPRARVFFTRVFFKRTILQFVF